MEELELTYLAKNLPVGFEKSPSKEMLDIYLPTGSEHPTLRVRRQGDRLEITKKEPINPDDRSHQLETTIPLTKEEYAELSQLPGKRLEKTRYYFEENGTTFEIDVFRGDLVGLVVVDVEFDSLEKKGKFVKPDWCLAEVTQENFIAGGMLCGKKYADIERDLLKFGYQKIGV